MFLVVWKCIYFAFASLEGLMLKLKLQYFGHLMWITDSFEKTLMLGKIKGERRGDNRGWDGWTASPTQWTWVWVSSGSWWWTGNPGVLQSMGLWRIRHDWVTELNWTELKLSFCTSNNSLHCLLASIASVKKSVINLIVYMIFMTPDFWTSWKKVLFIL